MAKRDILSDFLLNDLGYDDEGNPVILLFHTSFSTESIQNANNYHKLKM